MKLQKRVNLVYSVSKYLHPLYFIEEQRTTNVIAEYFLRKYFTQAEMDLAT